MHTDKTIDKPEARVVPVFLVFGTRVPEPANQAYAVVAHSMQTGQAAPVAARPDLIAALLVRLGFFGLGRSLVARSRYFASWNFLSFALDRFFLDDLRMGDTNDNRIAPGRNRG